MKSLSYKWFLIIGIFFLTTSYIIFNGAQKAHRLDLDLETIVRANIVSIEKCERYRASRSVTRSMFIPIIKYEYQFEGKNYINTKIFRTKGGAFSEENECKDFVSKMKLEENIIVWIDPVEPNFSAIYPSKPNFFAEIFIGVLGVLAILGFIYLNIKKRN